MAAAAAAAAAACDHKQVVGCALTAVPVCCACADKRPMATAYPTYIDGKGMRVVGQRWQRYCWKCRDHWNLHSDNISVAHSSASPLSSDQSTSPVPDNTMDSRHPNPFQVRDHRPADPEPWSFSRDPRRASVYGPRLERLRGDYQTQLTASALPSYHLASGPALPLPTPPPPLEITRNHGPNRYRQDQRRSGTSPRNRSQNHTLHAGMTPPAEHSFLNNEPPAANPLGTREEVQSDDYVSPIASMYGRAWHRYREAEDRRLGEQRRETQRNAYVNAVLEADRSETSNSIAALSRALDEHDELSQQFHESMNMQLRTTRENFLRMLRPTTQPPIPLNEPAQSNPLVEPEVTNPIDSQESRPLSLSTEEMTANIACRICHEQKIDTLLEPCMHVAICHWCIEVMTERVRRHRQGLSNGDERLRCPICRRNVNQFRKVYLSL